VSPTLELELEYASARFALAVSWSTDETALGIFGPSGAGKTTILEAIAGLRRDLRGRIVVGGRTWFDSAAGVRLPPERRGVGYVPQDARLFPHRDVRGNVLAGRRRAERSPARRLAPERVVEVLELSDLWRADVPALSGGERQRVALARALCSGPELLLLDEPLVGLDAPLRWRILPYLVRVQREFGIPTLHVSHEATEVRALCREALVLASGHEVARGRPGALFVDPAVLPLGGPGFENLLHGVVASVEDGFATVVLDSGGRILVAGEGAHAGAEALVAVRADDLIVATERPRGLSAQNVLPGTVSEIREGEAGHPDRSLRVLVRPALAEVPLVAQITPRSAAELGLAAGRSVHLVFKAGACRLLVAR
jgi:molybdate transport system ATP-binding protein